MKNETFWKTKAGSFTVVFIIVMLAFVIILIGLYQGKSYLYTTGCILIILSMLYSPVKKYILDRK